MMRMFRNIFVCVIIVRIRSRRGGDEVVERDDYDEEEEKVKEI
jgi:hypothetical protein